MNDSFADLPDALVRDLLAKATPVAEGVARNLNALREGRPAMRSNARNRGLIRRKADLDVPREPSVVGIDGSYQVHRLTALDLSAAAAVAVEGTSKEAVRHWPEPYHRIVGRMFGAQQKYHEHASRHDDFNGVGSRSGGAA